MKEISNPPKIITALSSSERSKISKSIILNEDIGLVWLEKIRKFISFHNRNLKKISRKRFGKDSLPHLIWMKEIINNKNEVIIPNIIVVPMLKKVDETIVGIIIKIEKGELFKTLRSLLGLRLRLFGRG